LKGLEKELDELNQKDAKLKASANALQQQISSEERKLKTLQKNIKIDEAALVKKEDHMTKV
jgi:predicted  nucleic acid-binding Zn-ribbon protein